MDKVSEFIAQQGVQAWNELVSAQVMDAFIGLTTGIVLLTASVCIAYRTIKDDDMDGELQFVFGALALSLALIGVVALYGGAYAAIFPHAAALSELVR